jgi:hypothetical protein
MGVLPYINNNLYLSGYETSRTALLMLKNYFYILLKSARSLSDKQIYPSGACMSQILL